MRVWKTQAVKIALFAFILVAVTIVYAFREKLTRLSTHKNKWPVNGFKYIFWAISMGWIGFVLMAQPSITPGIDMVSRVIISVDVVIVLVGSVYFLILDLYYRNSVLIWPWLVLRLDVSVWFFARIDL